MLCEVIVLFYEHNLSFIYIKISVPYLSFLLVGINPKEVINCYIYLTLMMSL